MEISVEFPHGHSSSVLRSNELTLFLSWQSRRHTLDHDVAAHHPVQDISVKVFVEFSVKLPHGYFRETSSCLLVTHV